MVFLIKKELSGNAEQRQKQYIGGGLQSTLQGRLDRYLVRATGRELVMDRDGRGRLEESHSSLYTAWEEVW